MDDTVISPDLILDTSGMLCPIPVIKTSKSIKQIQVGQVLKMISTDPGAVPDMDAWSRQTGHEMIESHQENDVYVFFFRRTR
jgi:tRNA 2-thiouridine synthesizing protein A